MKKLFICSSLAYLLCSCGGDSATSPSIDTGDKTVSSSSIESMQSSSAKESSDFKESSSSSATLSSTSEEESSSSEVIKGFPANYNPETGILTDERDGKVYKTAKIGDQIWMGQNLRYYTTEPAEGCEYTYNDESEDVSDLDTYGRLYSWIGAARIPCDYITKKASFEGDEFSTPHQGICPKGWHIPTLDEWKKMIEFTDGNVYKLLSTSWSGSRYNYAGTDEYGFNILPPPSGVYHVEYIILDNTSSKGKTMVFNDYTGTSMQLEVITNVKSVDDLYLRCLMD
ncbi:MAG: hypothetical protein II835_11110 [Fibrobacter sp.]|nr:hypothetical protein [Fibrobacter sp.]